VAFLCSNMQGCWPVLCCADGQHSAGRTSRISQCWEDN
jgi:hypothetical protein